MMHKGRGLVRALRLPDWLKTGGAEGNRTPGLVIANDALYQLSYGPTGVLFVPTAGNVKRVNCAVPGGL